MRHAEVKFSIVALMALSFVHTAAYAAPIISSVSASPVGDNWAQVTWTTDQNATSFVDYGLTAAYGSTASDTVSYTRHRITLFGLTPSTTYHFRVRSVNTSSQSSSSGDYTFTTKANAYGCEGNATGEPIGGGAGYSRIITPEQATIVVSTTSAFRSALSTARSGSIIYVDDNAAIDMTGYQNNLIPAGVTIASGRGRNGSPGGMIFSTTFLKNDSQPLFMPNGAGVRITGLRIVGPHNGRWRTVPMYRGIINANNWLEVDNCEFYGFNYSGIDGRSGAAGIHVHHCYLHHMTRDGCGYPVILSKAVGLVEGNILDRYRHSVASSGESGSSYEVRYNLIMENAINHTLDMHGGDDRGDGTDIAGTIMRIHHNTVRNLDQSAVCVRGKPEVGCWVNNNWFLRPYSTYVVRQLNATGNMFVADNLFGSQSDPAQGAGEWKFDEGSGTTAADSSGQGNTGTLTNMDTATCWVTGYAGKAIHFDGIDDKVDCGSGIAKTDNFALDFRVKFDAFADSTFLVNDGVVSIFHRGGSAGHKLFFRIHKNEGTTAGGDSWWGGYTAVKSTTEMVTGQWYHVVAARSGNKMQIFINDNLERELDAMAGYTVNNTGRTSLQFGGFNGSLDEVKFFTPGSALSTNHAPTLVWTGEANFAAAGVYPQTGAPTVDYTFRVKYSDADGDAPMGGYPRLRVKRAGTEFFCYSPITMFPIDTAAAYTTGRVYQCKLRLPRGSDYTYSFEAPDTAGNAATGTPTAATAGPTITTGNTAPILYYAENSNNYSLQQVVSPSSGNSNTSFDYRCGYMDLDGDAPKEGFPKLRITNSSGVEVVGSPFTMTQMDMTPLAIGRHYQLLKKLPGSSTPEKYRCQIITQDSQGAVAANMPASTYNYPSSVTYGGTMWTDVFTGAPNPLTSNSFQVAVSFAQPVTGFTQSDVVVTNGTISGFTGSGGFYAFTVTANAYGEVTVSVPAGVVSPSNLVSPMLKRTWANPVKNAAGENWTRY